MYPLWEKGNQLRVHGQTENAEIISYGGSEDKVLDLIVKLFVIV